MAAQIQPPILIWWKHFCLWNLQIKWKEKMWNPTINNEAKGLTYLKGDLRMTNKVGELWKQDMLKARRKHVSTIVLTSRRSAIILTWQMLMEKVVLVLSWGICSFTFVIKQSCFTCFPFFPSKHREQQFLWLSAEQNKKKKKVPLNHKTLHESDPQTLL